jgi:hypothetical protein
VNRSSKLKNQELIYRHIKEGTAFLDYGRNKVQFSIFSKTITIPSNLHWSIQKSFQEVYIKSIIISKHSGIEVEALLGYALERNHESESTLEECLKFFGRNHLMLDM